MPKIVVAGSLNMDLVVGASRLPQAGETVTGLSFATFEGGKGFNQAVAARRAGSEVAFIGKLGQDAFGDRLAAALKTEGINATGVTRVSDPAVSTGVASILVDTSGANTIVVVPAANFEFSPADLDNAAGVFQNAGALLLQLEIPLAVCQRAAQLAHRAGPRRKQNSPNEPHRKSTKVILTPAPVPSEPLPPALLGLLDLLVLNETEVKLLAALSGIKSVPNDEIEAARLLLGQPNRPGPSAVVVTLGARGAVWVTISEAITAPGFPVKAVDTTAAGDSFTGALAFALAENIPVPEALRFANAAGALAVTKAGAYPSIPTAAAISQFLKSY